MSETVREGELLIGCCGVLKPEGEIDQLCRCGCRIGAHLLGHPHPCDICNACEVMARAGARPAGDGR